jgi:acyl carrier protein
MDDILNILKSIRPEEDFRNADDFIEGGLLDSFDVVSLVDALDSHYGISIEGVEIVPENFQNLASIRALLEKHGVTF